jgi:hypothetical protein
MELCKHIRIFSFRLLLLLGILIRANIGERNIVILLRISAPVLDFLCGILDQSSLELFWSIIQNQPIRCLATARKTTKVAINSSAAAIASFASRSQNIAMLVPSCTGIISTEPVGPSRIFGLSPSIPSQNCT